MDGKNVRNDRKVNPHLGENMKLNQDLPEYLRTADPHLILHVALPVDDGTMRVTPHICEQNCVEGEVIEEGFDPDLGPFGSSYWSIVNRGDEELFCITHCVTREDVRGLWGVEGLPYCDAVTGSAVARTETKSNNEGVWRDLVMAKLRSANGRQN